MKNHIGYYLKLHKVKDIEIINKLEELSNKQGYIKGLIKKDLDINNIKGVQNGIKIDCRDCREFMNCPCGKDGHENGTSRGYSIGECKDFKPQESEVSNGDG